MFGTFILIVPLVLTSIMGVIIADRETVSTMSGTRSSSGSRLLGGERCTWGPSYWCAQMKNAKQCSAVNHCAQTVWSKQAEPQDPSAICRWCDDLMDDIRELVSANTSKTTMRGYLKDGCRRIPDANRRTTCVDDLSTDLNEIRQMLAANVPDRTICRTINFCSLPTSPIPDTAQDNIPFMPLVPTGLSNRNYCRDCYNFFEDAKEIYIGNYTEDEFKQMLLDQCDQAGYAALTELCKTVIEQYWPQIYARLQVFFDPEEVCYQLNFCNTSSTINPKWMLPMVPVSVARARKAQKLQQSPMQLPLNRMLLNLDISPMTMQRSPSIPKKINYKSDVQCVVCEFVMSYLDKMLADNYTEAAIQSALNRVCNVMPKSVRDDCQSFVNEYAPAILVILGNELDPAMVCTGLNLCSGQKPAASNTGLCAGGTASCASCTEVFQIIKALMEDYDENVRLANLIKSYCMFFPGEAKTQCELAVVTYVPYALQMIAQLLNPEAVCQAVKICPDKV